MAKPKVAFFDFGCCEGCQLCAIDVTPEQLLDLVSVVDIVEFREAMSEKAGEEEPYDVAIVEGSITRETDVKRLEEIRRRSGLLVAFGACAHIGGINALKNFQEEDSYRKAVYPDDPYLYDTGPARAVGEVVQADAFIPGCPIDTDEFLRVVKNLVVGKSPGIPDYPVCVECKMKENICVYEKGWQCLGPVIRAGCGARCPSNGFYCFGCRGMIPEPNVNSQQDIMQKYDLTFEQMRDKFKLFLQRNEEVFPNG